MSPVDPADRTVKGIRDEAGVTWVRAENGESDLWRRLHVVHEDRLTPEQLLVRGPLTDITLTGNRAYVADLRTQLRETQDRLRRTQQELGHWQTVIVPEVRAEVSQLRVELEHVRSGSALIEAQRSARVNAESLARTGVELNAALADRDTAIAALKLIAIGADEAAEAVVQQKKDGIFSTLIKTRMVVCTDPAEIYRVVAKVAREAVAGLTSAPSEEAL